MHFRKTLILELGSMQCSNKPIAGTNQTNAMLNSKPRKQLLLFECSDSSKFRYLQASSQNIKYQ